MKKIGLIILVLLLLAAPAFAEAAGWSEISTPAELAKIAENPGGQYRLVNDIDMTGIDWKPIPLNGVLDGNGFAILNLSVTRPGETHFPSRDGNEKTYDTVGAGLFDCCVNARICNLGLLGANVTVDTDENCFCGLLCGGGENITVENCEIDGRVQLTQTAKMCGVSGLIGYARCAVAKTNIRADVVLVDRNNQQSCEEFGAGVLACGFADIYDCKAATDIYASVHGYCHNGGLIGMQLRHGYQHRRVLSNNSVWVRINFFEHTKSRRAYANAFVGEMLGETISYRNNKKPYFKIRESKDYNTELYPCRCSVPCTQEIVAPTETGVGYTINTCPQCGYTYNGSYVARLTASTEAPTGN